MLLLPAVSLRCARLVLQAASSWTTPRSTPQRTTLASSVSDKALLLLLLLLLLE
jgi:hypothetical protein